MNTMVSAFRLQQGTRRASAMTHSMPGIGTYILGAILLLSALAVVYVSDFNRRVFIAYQQEQAQHQQLYLEWNQLLAQQSSWSAQSRIQSIASQRLGMKVPIDSQIQVINDK